MLLDLLDAFRLLLDSEHIIQVGGLLLILAIVFAETGLFFGFFLPGDYLLFAAGLFCNTEYLPYPVLLLATMITVAAVLGNFVGFAFGWHVGEKLFKRQDSWFFKQSYLQSSEKYFEDHGRTTLIIARFLPVIRTFAPILAGVHKMPVLEFALLNIAGAVLWVFSLTLAGYYLGVTFPQIMDYIHWIIIAFIALTSVVVVRGYLKLRKGAKEQNPSEPRI